MNPSYQPSELRYALNKVGIRTLIAAESFKNRNYFDILSEAVPEMNQQNGPTIESRTVPNLKSVIMISEEHIK